MSHHTVRRNGFRSRPGPAVPLALLLLAACGAARAGDPPGGPPDSGLESLVEEALANNPQVHAADRRAEAARAMVPQARTLPDPMLILSYEDVDMRETMYGISQELPFPGKLRLKGEMATRDAEAMEQDALATRLGVIARLKETYYELLLAGQAIAIIGKNQALLVEFARAAEAGYGVGRMAQADVFRAQAEVSRGQARLAKTRQEQQSLAAEMARLLGRHGTAAVEITGTLRASALRRSPADILALVDQSPMLLVRGKAVERGNAALELARREYLPDFEVGLQGVHDEPMGSDGYQVMLNVTVPLFFATKQRYGVREALASREGATSDLAATRQELVMRVRDELARIERADRLTMLLRDAIIPQAELTLASARSGYGVGRVDFLTLVSSLFTLQENELELAMETAEHEKAAARIEEIIGEWP